MPFRCCPFSATLSLLPFRKGNRDRASIFRILSCPFSVALSQLPFLCCPFSVALSLLPFLCCSFSVALSLLPFLCCPFSVALSLLLFLCCPFSVALSLLPETVSVCRGHAARAAAPGGRAAARRRRPRPARLHDGAGPAAVLGQFPGRRPRKRRPLLRSPAERVPRVADVPKQCERAALPLTLGAAGGGVPARDAI